MKKIYLLVAGLMASVGISTAQRVETTSNVVHSNKTMNNSTRAYTGFITSHVNGTTWSASSVNGTNQYGDWAKGQQFNVVSPYSIEGAIIEFGVGKYNSADANSKVTVNLFDMTGTGETSAGPGQAGPGAVLATVDIPMSQIAADVAANNYSVASFTSPVTVSANYVIAVDISNLATGDTVRLWSNYNAAAGTELGWEQWNDGSWYSLIASWGPTTGKRNFAIYPIVECITDLIYTLTPVDATACGADGSASINITNSNSNWTLVYDWIDSNSDTIATTNPTALTAGSYNLEISDELGCTISETLTISEPVAPTLTSSATDLLSCTSNDGTATIAVVGGASTYSYLWDDASAQTTDTATGLRDSAYTVTVTDNATNCSATANVTVADARVYPSVAVASNATTICGGSDGDATATVTGASTYSYLWDDALAQTTATASALSLGTYSVVVTDNANGCETSKTATVTDGGAPSITLTADSVSCNGLADGSATITSASDISAYTFTWSDNQTGITASNLMAGNYTVSGTDGVCIINGNVTIGQPTALTATATATDISCNGLTDGSVTISANGGTPNYTYSWTPGNETTASVDTLGAGTYSVTVTDANGCTSTDSATVIEPAILTATAGSTDITCNGDADGSLSGTANGGTAPFAYSWTGGANTANVSNVDAGTYTLTITDNSGCTASSSAVTVAEPTALGLTGIATDATFGMSDGSVSVTATGGTNPYAYSWAPSGGNAATASNLAANDYTVTITDANGCTKTGTYTVANAGNPPCAIAVELDTMTSASNGGNNGAITVSVSGNYGSITYSWTPAAPNSPTITALTAGNYTVIVADTMGCMDTLTVNVPNVTGISTNEISKVNIYPTPVASNLNISFNSIENNNASVKVISLTGQVVYSENIRTSNGVFKTSIDMSNQASGVYFLQIIAGENNITKKVIKN